MAKGLSEMFIGEEPKTLEECFERLVKDRDRLIDECDYPSNYNLFNAPASEEQIEKLEKTHNVKLPEDYKEFLRFANGATIMGTSATIYGTDMFGIRDLMVPDEYYTVGERIGDGERIALNPADGELYSCYNGKVKLFDLEHELHRFIEECEEEIIASEKEKAQAAKDPETLKREEEEYKEYMIKLKKTLGLL